MRRLSDGPAAAARPLKPVKADPSADPTASTADLFFEAANSDHALLPGERVIVVLPLRQSAESLVVPWSAVVYDFHGSSWVYENPEPELFVRRRVELREPAGRQAVLTRGPAPGTRVVSAGAAELFGTEFGIGK